MGWTKAKILRQAGTSKGIFAGFAAITQLLLANPSVFSRDLPRSFADANPDLQGIFAPQPKSDDGAADTAQQGQVTNHVPAAASPYQLDTVLGQEPQTFADFVAQYGDSRPDEPSAEQVASFLAGINPLLVSHGREAISGLLPQKTPTLSLTITKVDKQITFAPSMVHLDGLNQIIEVVMQGFGEFSPRLYVRNPSLLAWDSLNRQLASIDQGMTEILIASPEGMIYALPVSIGAPADAQADLAPKPTLTAIAPLAGTGVFPSSPTLVAPQALQLKPSVPVGNEIIALSGSGKFVLKERNVGYTNIGLQIVDDRSRFEDGKPQSSLYPASGVTVKIIGTEFSAVTGALGTLDKISVPQNSRLLVSLYDGKGLYRPSIHEIITGDREDQGTITIKIMRSFIYENLLQVANISPGLQQGSLCGVVRGGEHNLLAGISVEVDWEGIKPLYFNEFGLPEVQLTETSGNGRFCFFAVPEGPAALSFVDNRQENIDAAQENTLARTPHTFFTGIHREELFVLDESAAFTTRVASVASAHDQQLPTGQGFSSYQELDYAELWLFGMGKTLKQAGYGLITAPPTLVANGDRTFFVTKYEEPKPTLFEPTTPFEPTLYQIDNPGAYFGGALVTPLIPNGFVNDMLIYAQQSLEGSLHDVNQGTILIEHGTLLGEDSAEKTLIKLFDFNGLEVRQAVYFGDNQVRKALFYNVPPGSYQVMIETDNGYWLAVNTVLVYGQTLSYLRTGSPTVFAAN